MRSSFNAWEAKNLIGGQKYIVAMSILKPMTQRALQSRNLRSFRINIKFVLVFDFQTLGYKPNPVSCEKISQTFVSLSIVHSHVCNGIRLKTAFFHMHVMV